MMSTVWPTAFGSMGTPEQWEAVRRYDAELTNIMQRISHLRRDGDEIVIDCDENGMPWLKEIKAGATK